MPKAADNTNPIIIALCGRVVPGAKPIYLDVEAADGAIVNDCYENVAKAVKQNGGSVQHGWQIWETLPGVMAEAEFHAVWVDANGTYHDITPKASDDITSILFLADPHRRFEGRQINNLRVPLQEDPLIQRFIENADQYFEVTNRGELADQLGYITETPEMKRLWREKAHLEMELLQKYYSGI
jgi:hypothetical protein